MPNRRHNVVQEANSLVSRLGVEERVQRLHLEAVRWPPFTAVEVVAKGQDDLQHSAQLRRVLYRLGAVENRIDLLERDGLGN